MFLAIFRLANLFLLGNGLYNSLTTKLPPHLVKSGQFQFITNCSLLLAVINLAFTILSLRSIWLYNLASNLEFNVIFSYWTMVLLFPQMVAEDEVDRNLFMDLQVHAFPYIYLIIDFQPRVSFATSVMLTGGFVFGYWFYIEWECGKHIADGVSGYPYPFLKGKNKWQRLKCISVFAILACCNWFILSIRSNSI